MHSQTLSVFKLFDDRKRPYLMAHRGNRVKFPENTLASFSQAFTDGADILETDLQISRDGEFMCIHDGTVDRTTDGTGNVSSFLLKELKKLHILDLDGTRSGLDIPTLSETANQIPADKVVALELKSDQFLEIEVCEKLALRLEECGISDRTIFLSFSLQRLKQAKIVMPGVPIGWITLSRIIPDQSVDLIGPLWPIIYLNPFYVRMAHKRGMFVCPLDPEPEARLPKYIKMNCDAILADDPGTVKKRLDFLSRKT